MTILAIIFLIIGVASVIWTIATYWINTETAPGMGADIGFSQQWLLAGLLFSLSALSHPSLHWGWALSTCIGFALLNIPVKMVVSEVFEFLRRTRHAP